MRVDESFTMKKGKIDMCFNYVFTSIKYMIVFGKYRVQLTNPINSHNSLSQHLPTTNRKEN
jgi:hypothetical protein